MCSFKSSNASLSSASCSCMNGQNVSANMGQLSTNSSNLLSKNVSGGSGISHSNLCRNSSSPSSCCSISASTNNLSANPSNHHMCSKFQANQSTYSVKKFSCILSIRQTRTLFEFDEISIFFLKFEPICSYV